MNSADGGIALARAYWADVVRPLLEDICPGLPRAVARIGCGSDVLGLDDEMSRDHDWGLRLQVLVPPDSRAEVAAGLEARLPDSYAAHPTRMVLTGRTEPISGVDVLAVDDLWRARLGFDPRSRTTAVTDWLSLTGQAALELTAGAVFEDSDGGLTALRSSLSWYPDDLWRRLVATDWRRLDQELPLLQRAGQRGDDLGSRMIAARLVDVAIHLGFLLCRRWAPYPKWRGTLFQRLPLDPACRTELARALAADSWQARRDGLAAALDCLAEHQHQAGLATAGPACVPFWDRPFLQIDPRLSTPPLGDTDDALRALPAGLGSIEQRTDNVDLLVDVGLRRAAVGCPPT